MAALRNVLIANRGEIACRIARTCRARGLGVATIHSSADARARHVREIGESVLVGGAAASDSYLRIDAVLAAARTVGADAIHPGYGFLAENPDFCRAVEAAGLCFIGPSADTLEGFGDKAAAKQAASANGVPTIPGSDGALHDPQAIGAAALTMGLPLLLKAAAGGGGRGQRVVRDADTLAADIEAALREARSAFGESGLILERLIENARHVEVQIAGDGQGRVIHLFERDCSLQRRHQKVIEEAPAPGLAPALLERIRADAVRLCASVGYRGLGTVEFLVQRDDYWFLEVNPRLQVEHPVTEAVTGLDLVALQLRIAAGDGLGLSQDDVRLRGHAVEARIYAEDPRAGFAPSTGLIRGLTLPDGMARIESGVDDGDEITPYYDAMIAKLVTLGPDRAAAFASLEAALDGTAVGGLTANIAFLKALVRRPEVRSCDLHTRLIDTVLDDILGAGEDADRERLRAAVATTVWLLSQRGTEGTWQAAALTGWRLGTGALPVSRGATLRMSAGASAMAISVTPAGDRFLVTVGDGQPVDIRLAREAAAGMWSVETRTATWRVNAVVRGSTIVLSGPIGAAIFQAEGALAGAATAQAAEGSVHSPLMGIIVKVAVRDGQIVDAGETVAVLESMKMEMPIKAPRAGRVTGLACEMGQMVERGQKLAEIVEGKTDDGELS